MNNKGAAQTAWMPLLSAYNNIRFSRSMAHTCKTNTFKQVYLIIWNSTEDENLENLKIYIGFRKTQFFERKSETFSYPSVLAYVLGAQKKHLIETVLLSTQNLCFG